MPRNLPKSALLATVVLVTGCYGERPEPIVRTEIRFCPEVLPTCPTWERRTFESFEYNIEAERDRIDGQEAYGVCIRRLEAAHVAREACECAVLDGGCPDE